MTDELVLASFVVALIDRMKDDPVLCDMVRNQNEAFYWKLQDVYEFACNMEADMKGEERPYTVSVLEWKETYNLGELKNRTRW